MHLPVVQRILGLLLMLFSSSMLPPIAISLIYKDGSSAAFIQGFAVTLIAGAMIWFPVRKEQRELRLRDGFIIVAAFWVVLGTFGAAPLMFSTTPNMTITDAVFEAISGLTTTGATVLSGLDILPESILYYRQQLQWLGGMGIIVLAVAVLPMLGVGGMQLYRAETPGPVKDTKLTPRITETAKALWYIYLGLTIACAVSYFVAGMNLFDAICHSFSTVAIGGFSTHDASIGFFSENHPFVELIAIVFMSLSGVNFSLHFFAWRSYSIQHYLEDPEFKAYTWIMIGTLFVVLTGLYMSGEYSTLRETITKGLFQVVSIATTTGFTTTNFSAWPGTLPVLLLFASFIGGCAGSTGGGMKVMRCLLLYKQGLREVHRLVHPNAEVPVKLGSMPVPQPVIDAVWGFFAVYVVLFVLMMVVVLATGIDQVTAFSAIAASLNNLGPGLGDVATGFSDINNISKWVCICAMLLGRLEIFTLLVLVSPTFWRH
ncbi:MAG: TrkH family potassium uptake protein [Gammaproteobacteria bacterium]|jgi:trk system potassium uptake protein TrkH|nr:potassium transporter [Chromatiales bacterium]MDP6675024.1 TrkH family potassium uptake protein [Gammaproteobacteria bacterium]